VASLQQRGACCHTRRLPFETVLMWAGLDELMVDSENSVAVLLTAWYHHAVKEQRQPSQAQCKQLSRRLRLLQLSPAFVLQVCCHCMPTLQLLVP
jgi:hypothetical protein